MQDKRGCPATPSGKIKECLDDVKLLWAALGDIGLAQVKVSRIGGTTSISATIVAAAVVRVTIVLEESINMFGCGVGLGPTAFASLALGAPVKLCAIDFFCGGLFSFGRGIRG